MTLPRSDVWSESESSLMREMWADGFPVKTIADRLGRSPAAVKKKRQTLGLGPRSRGPSVNLRITVSEDLLAWIRKQARREGRPIVGYVHKLLQSEYQRIKND